MFRLRTIRQVAARLRRERKGSVGIVFSVVMVPVVAMAGAALDYSRASTERTSLQAALDVAVLAAAKDSGANWSEVATLAFNEAFASPKIGATITPTFRKEGDTFSGSALAIVPTTLMNLAGVREVRIGAQAGAVQVKGDPDHSCILTLDAGAASTHEALTFNGAPNVAMTGCTIRSNSSLRCNGHDARAQASIAVGTASGCSNPQSKAPAVPDSWAGLAGSITPACTAWPGAVWEPGSPPAAPKMVTVQKSSYVQYHVCGDLTLTGSGFLTGQSPASDSVIVVENGSLTMDKDAEITMRRVTIVLTGDNSKPSTVNFPNGNGKAATLTLSPPTSSGNPWQGISLYQDPKLTSVDEDWGPGATLNIDGVVYLPNANVRMHGNAGSVSPTCSKLVTKTFTSNGGVNLRQTVQGCSSLGVKQWSGPPTGARLTS